MKNNLFFYNGLPRLTGNRMVRILTALLRILFEKKKLPQFAVRINFTNQQLKISVCACTNVYVLIVEKRPDCMSLSF